MMTSRVLLFIFITTTVLFTGCGTTESDPETYNFGANYTVLVEGEFPAIIDDELHVEVHYTGCEPNHEFSLTFEEVNENEFEVWLMKITPNQDCEEPFQEMQIFMLPDELLTGRIMFIGPNVHMELRGN